jgi:hypothetical protein
VRATSADRTKAEEGTSVTAKPGDIVYAEVVVACGDSMEFSTWRGLITKVKEDGTATMRVYDQARSADYELVIDVERAYPVRAGA